MKKKIFAGVLVVMMVAAVGCGNSGGGASSTAASSAASSSSAVASSSAQAAGPSSSAVITDSSMVTGQSGASTAASSTFAASSAAAPSSVAQKKGTIQTELDKIEETSDKFKNMDWGSMPQQTMNKNAADWYKLWDDELNSLWERLMEKIKPARKDNTVFLQKEWIQKKEDKIKKAGSEAEGGSLQPYLEACEGMRLTRARCYYIGSLLVESIGGEPYKIPDDAMKVLTEK